jgi:ATP-dependent protease ClpP protease subunit
MGSWNELLQEVDRAGSIADTIRKRSLRELHETTGRNIIVYYSGWLQKPHLRGAANIRFDINDADKEAFMATIHGMDRDKGLDLFLHTPGGEVAATESLVNYLRAMFGTNIRAVVPQLAMSGGTMIACACERIVMGKQSSLGPIDPQFAGLPAHGVIEEFDRAAKEIGRDPTKVAVWQPIIAKYHPTLIGECEKAIKWSEEIAREWLVGGMFRGLKNAKSRAQKVVRDLGDHALQKSHARHISLDAAKRIGLEVDPMEQLVPGDPVKSQELQDAILSVHHACIITFMRTDAYKIIENHSGVSQILAAQQHPS